MSRKSPYIFLVSFLSFAFLVACGPSQAEMDATATKMAGDIFSTQTAQVPTATKTPTPTLTPTNTPTPTNIPTVTPTPSPTASPSPTLVPTPSIPFALYESEQYPFSIQYPAEWDELPEEEGITVGYAEDGGSLFIAEEDFQEVGLGDVTLEEYADLVLAFLDMEFPNHILLSSQELVTEQGLPILILETILNPGEQPEIILRRLIYIYEGHIIFNATIGTNNTEYYENLTGYLLNTFRLTEAPSETEEAAMFECTDEIGCVALAPGDPVHIASMLTISGATAFLGEDSVGAIEIAIDDRGGKLLNRDIQYTSLDTLCSAAGGQTATAKVASDPTIIGVIGTNCSSAMTAAMDTMSSAGLVMLSPSNTAPALTFEGGYGTWKPGYFRISHTDIFQGLVAAEFAYNELGARTLATIHDGSPYAVQLQEVMAAHFVELGGEVTFQGSVNVGDIDVGPVLTSAAADSPDVLYFPIFEPEGDFIVAQSSEIAGLENTTLIGADGFLVDSFPENSGSNVVGMYLSGPFVTGAAYDEFLRKWDVKFGGLPPSGFHAFAYDGTNILFDAIEEVAVTDAEGTTFIGRQALRDAIKATAGYNGLTGTLDCSDKQFGDFTSKADCATGESLGIFQITEAELAGNWPPPVIYTP